jgi:hypothetical protein
VVQQQSGSTGGLSCDPIQLAIFSHRWIGLSCLATWGVGGSLRAT